MSKRTLIIIVAILGGILAAGGAILMVAHDPQTGEVWERNPLEALVIFSLFTIAIGGVGAFAGGIFASLVPSSQKRNQQRH